MATRILITCKSHTVPSADKDKATLLTNQACQMVFSRDFNETLGDRLVIEGEFSFGVRCSLLVDNGPVDSTDYAISFFRWNGTELIRHPLPPYAARNLEERYQFNPANRPQRISYTDDEFEKKFGSEKYNELVKSREERRDIARRFGHN